VASVGQLPGDAAPDTPGPDDAHLHLPRLLALRSPLLRSR
jgi:hypothetical protein